MYQADSFRRALKGVRVYAGQKSSETQVLTRTSSPSPASSLEQSYSVPHPITTSAVPFLFCNPPPEHSSSQSTMQVLRYRRVQLHLDDEKMLSVVDERLSERFRLALGL